MSLEAFRVVSDWYHFAILELTEIEEFKSDVKWIAQTLGIGAKVCALAIDRLKKLELLEDNKGVLRQTAGFMATPSGIPSDAIKKFHQQILDKAQSALFTQTVDERDFSTMVFPVNEKDIPWAKDQIKSFRRQFLAKLQESKPKTRLYALAIQFFRLQENFHKTNSQKERNQ